MRPSLTLLLALATPLAHAQTNLAAYTAVNFNSDNNRVAISTQFDDWQYQKVRCLDNDLTTNCGTNNGGGPNTNWIAVQVAAGTRVGPVAVYNRRDYTSIQPWMGTIEVRVAATAGDASSGTSCGSATYRYAAIRAFQWLSSASASSSSPVKPRVAQRASRHISSSRRCSNSS